MNFFIPAMQTTISFCGIPILFIACLITLVWILLLQKRNRSIEAVTYLKVFLLVILVCTVVVALGNWIFRLKTQPDFETTNLRLHPL